MFFTVWSIVCVLVFVGFLLGLSAFLIIVPPGKFVLPAAFAISAGEFVPLEQSRHFSATKIQNCCILPLSMPFNFSREANVPVKDKPHAFLCGNIRSYTKFVGKQRE